MTASKKYIAMGSSTGGLYIFDRKTLRHLRFISNKVSSIAVYKVFISSIYLEVVVKITVH